jgi:hypothetical protein
MAIPSAKSMHHATRHHDQKMRKLLKGHHPRKLIVWAVPVFLDISLRGISGARNPPGLCHSSIKRQILRRHGFYSIGLS